MGGRRVFVSGLGSELGTLVAGMLEAEPWVGALAGIDADPPRRRLPNTTFHRISPDQHDRPGPRQPIQFRVPAVQGGHDFPAA